jgi:hypothetical protein
MGFRDDLTSLGFNIIGAAGTLLQKAANAGLTRDDTKNNDSTVPIQKDPSGNARQLAVPTEKATEDPKSLFWDPFSIIEQLGYKDRPSQISYGTLRAMAWRCPIVEPILRLRLDQMGAFCVPQHDKYRMGYRLKLRDTEREPTKAELKWIQDMEPIIQRTGVTDNPKGRDNFETFVKKVMRDSLVYDQMTFEVVPNRKGQPAEWYAVDASTIRLASSASTFIDEDDTKVTRFVQIYDGMVIAEWPQGDFCFAVRNPHTDIRLSGYGVSELELLIHTVTAFLYSWEYNKRFFSQGSTTKGIINFKGAIPNTQLHAFRQQWYQMISGVENAWRTPVVSTASDAELQYVDLHKSNRDMEYGAWMDFLIKNICSMYKTDPIEINFKYGNVGQRSGLQEASNTEKITESKERGLRPLLRFMAQQINDYIIHPINPEFEFEFVGLDAQTRENVAQLNTTRVKTFMTVDEIRAEEDKPPLPDGKGEVILDPTWLQASQMVQGIPGEGDMGEGESEAGFDRDENEEDNSDFQKLLAQYENENDKEDESEKPKEKTEKGLQKSWVIEL